MPVSALTDLDALASREDVSILDTRRRADFFSGHLPGSLHAPHDDRFEAVVRAYVEAGREVVLVADVETAEAAAQSVEAAGRGPVVGYVTPESLAAWGRGTDRLRMLKSIDFDELDGRRHYTNVAVLDVRSAAEREERHIPGSLHIPLLDVKARLDELPRDQTILLHCGGGGRATVAASLLHANGFCVAAVDDAFTEWKEREASVA